MSLYDLLGVEEGASADELKAAYRAALKANHPDVTGDDDVYAANRIIKLNEAYHVLSDPELRVRYDRKRREGADGSGYGRESRDEAGNRASKTTARPGSSVDRDRVYQDEDSDVWQGNERGPGQGSGEMQGVLGRDGDREKTRLLDWLRWGPRVTKASRRDSYTVWRGSVVLPAVVLFWKIFWGPSHYWTLYVLMWLIASLWGGMPRWVPYRMVGFFPLRKTPGGRVRAIRWVMGIWAEVGITVALIAASQGALWILLLLKLMVRAAYLERIVLKERRGMRRGDLRENLNGGGYTYVWKPRIWTTDVFAVTDRAPRRGDDFVHMASSRHDTASAAGASGITDMWVDCRASYTVAWGALNVADGRASRDVTAGIKTIRARLATERAHAGHADEGASGST